MILGPSGTGKSVCIKHIVGLLYPDQGDVIVHGRSMPSLPDAELFEMRKKFGVLFQDGALFGSMNLYDNVAFPLRQHTEKGEEEIAEIVNRRMREVGLGGEGEKMPNELSGGMRKRAGFARSLVLEPEIVLFDEPDSGLDPVRTALLCELIKEVHAENGGCYVVITHDIMSARRVAEHISVLWKGRIVESGPAEELFDLREPVRAPVPRPASRRARWEWSSTGGWRRPRHLGASPDHRIALGLDERPRGFSRPRGRCGARPRLVLASRWCSASAVRRSRWGCTRRRRQHVRVELERHLPGRRSASTGASAKSRSRCSSRATSSSSC